MIESTECLAMVSLYCIYDLLLIGGERWVSFTHSRLLSDIEKLLLFGRRSIERTRPFPWSKLNVRLLGSGSEQWRVEISKSILYWIIFVNSIDVVHYDVTINSMDGILSNIGMIECRRLLSIVLLSIWGVFLSISVLNSIQTSINILTDISHFNLTVWELGVGVFEMGLGDIDDDLLIGKMDCGSRDGLLVISKS